MSGTFMHTDIALGYAPMDHIHEEFVGLSAALQDARDEELAARLALMEAHLKAHFGQEDAWMVQTGFPPRECHIKEHAAVLASVGEVRSQLEQGDFQACRELARALAEWFPGHATHLDSALAHWMCKQRFGAKPLVFRPKQLTNA
ncbi:hemerythrin [Bordetella hinzii]|nr:hemerythrin [Bordetella hinzii]